MGHCGVYRRAIKRLHEIGGMSAAQCEIKEF